jgi:hypothetical protein
MTSQQLDGEECERISDAENVRGGDGEGEASMVFSFVFEEDGEGETDA